MTRTTPVCVAATPIVNTCGAGPGLLPIPFLLPSFPPCLPRTLHLDREMCIGKRASHLQGGDDLRRGNIGRHGSALPQLAKVSAAKSEDLPRLEQHCRVLVAAADLADINTHCKRGEMRQNQDAGTRRPRMASRRLSRSTQKCLGPPPSPWRPTHAYPPPCRTP